MIRIASIIILIYMLPFLTVSGQEINEVPFDDPQLETRAINLHKRLRCLVCQNQSIHESNAELARDLRIVVRERISEGETDAEAIQYFVDRYGEWVLLNPPFMFSTLALWLGPLIILLISGMFVATYLRRKPDTTPAPLTGEERKRLEDLLE